ncbi:hypothetical protein B0H65DRAFT_414622 [Neurospora tetraspora]|uniref:NAD(P)-binding protein n=1 Tax=Neurospora tetraspora TaxID=94610 RepID=A0AAE0JP74_9PEZI|nr:hypothetical protein B0H65DRAFT_414622 [Neurospora tetraspora]
MSTPTPTPSTPVWLITGCTSGFGRSIAFESLSRGHKVIATARNSSRLVELKAAGAAVMDLDVTSDDETLAQKMAEANEVYGRITHVVNCAGYILEGGVEEASNKEVFDHYNTNVLGTFNVARAVTKYLRAAAAAVPGGQQVALANFGSLGSWWSGAGVAHYCSTKFAVSGLTEGLAEELKPFGIDVCVIEPGYTQTGFLARGAGGDGGGGGGDHRVVTERKIAAYEGTAVAAVHDALEAYNGKQPGDVDKSAKVIVDVLTKDGVAKGREVPVRLALGTDTLEVIRKKCEETLRLIGEWEEISRSTMRDEN